MLFAMGGYGSYLGWQIRLAGDAVGPTLLPYEAYARSRLPVLAPFRLYASLLRPYLSAPHHAPKCPSTAP